jgi:hypothetical protein
MTGEGDDGMKKMRKETTYETREPDNERGERENETTNVNQGGTTSNEQRDDEKGTRRDEARASRAAIRTAGILAANTSMRDGHKPDSMKVGSKRWMCPDLTKEQMACAAPLRAAGDFLSARAWMTTRENSMVSRTVGSDFWARAAVRDLTARQEEVGRRDERDKGTTGSADGVGTKNDRSGQTTG